MTVVRSEFSCAALRSCDSFLHLKRCQPKFFQIKAYKPPLRLARPAGQLPKKGAVRRTRRRRSSDRANTKIARGTTYVFQACALVVLEQAVLPAEMAVAEAAITDDALRHLLALLVRAADLLGGHAPAHGHHEVQCGFGLDAVGGEGGVGGGEVLPCVDEVEGGGWKGGAQGEERLDVREGDVNGDGERDDWGGLVSGCLGE